MKSKKKKFNKFLDHDENNPDEVDKKLEPIIQSIGYVVMHFNALEESLNHVICAFLSDDTDSKGLIVLHKMNYSGKVDLFKRLCDNYQTSESINVDIYDKLVNQLRECGRLRNQVIHADWENTDNDSYTYVKLNISKNNIVQEYVQFSEDSLTEIILLIMRTRDILYKYIDERGA